MRKLLGLPDNYQVLWLQGGATMQFAMIPMNLLAGGKKADYTNTGSWAKKAIADAKKIGDIGLAYDGSGESFTTLPPAADLKVRDAVYLHLTSNETIGGVQWHEWPDVPAPIVCDMSSDFLSRRLPLEKFGIIYAGAQKNLAPAGVTVVIIRDDVLEQCTDDLPAYLAYKTHAPKDSLYNTPPVFPIWVARLVLDYVLENGGLEWAEKLADERSGLIYGMIDKHGGILLLPRGRALPLEDERRVASAHGGPREAIHRRGQGEGHGRPEGPPFGGRLPRQHLQRHARGGRAGAGRLHGRVRAGARLSLRLHGR